METFVEGFSTTVAAPQEQILFCFEVTRSVWRRSATGGASELIDRAYRRITGRDVPASPVMFAAVWHEGRMKSVNLYPGCVMIVHDPARGSSEIRTLRPEARAKLDRLNNVSEVLKRSRHGADRRLGQVGIDWAKQT